MKSVLITSSILIALIAVLRPILRGKIDPRIQYALWLLAALRLLVPVDLAHSAYSALALLNRAEEPRQIVEAIGQTSIPSQSYDSAHAQVIDAYQKQGVSTADLTPHDLMDIDAQARELMQGPTLAELAAKYAKPLWLGGAVVMAAWFLLVNLRIRQKLGEAELIEVEQTSGLPVFVSMALPSPCLCGVVRPAIYITPAAAEDPDRLRHVLAHESTHYRHRDHWWALVRCLCLCMYWFDPLVWWAAALSRQDCELACDAGAIRRLGEEERLPYGRTLVAMIASGRSSLLQTATTMTGGRRRVRERVTLIARKPKTVIALALALVLVLALAVGFTFTGAPDSSPSPDPNPLSSNSLNTANLSMRLMDVPAELYPDVDALSGGSEPASLPSILVEYWMHRPWTDYSEGWGWLLTVYRWNQEEFDANYSTVTGQLNCFARDSAGYYYITRRASDIRWPATTEMMAEFEGATQADIDNNAYMTAFEAIRSYAIQTVLETEGVEPYEPGVESALPAGALQARLLNLPEGLRDEVSTSPAMGGEVGCLASYWLNDPKWVDQWSGYLLDLYQLDEARIQEKLDNALWPAVDIFARSGGQYYAIVWAGDGRYQDGSADSEEYWNAVHTIFDYVKAAVLATEGVEPFDPYTTPPHFFSGRNLTPLDPGAYAVSGLDYTPVTSYQNVPEDPEQWFLVGWLSDAPLWMFTRNHGQETMFQVDDHLTQTFPYTARFFSQVSASGRAPQLMPLEGFGWGAKGTFGPFAVITHRFQGGTDQQYQLTVYDLDSTPVSAYVHDWEPLMNDFNANHTIELDEARHTATISYLGESVEIAFSEAEWENVRQYGFAAGTYEYIMTYSFNDDGTFNLEMPINAFTTPYVAVWTIRFTGNGFTTVGFHFLQCDDSYLYISAPH